MTTTDNTSQEPVNSERSTPSDETSTAASKRTKKGHDFYDLSPEEQRELEWKEQVTLEYLRAQKDGSGYGACKRAAETLGITKRRMQYIAIAYRNYSRPSLAVLQRCGILVA
jgi:hypothetical protein